MRLLHKDRHTESVGHDGVEYERDEHGAFELPHELAESLLERFPHLWEIAPEPIPAEPVKPRRGSKPKLAEETEETEDPADVKTEQAPADPQDGGTGDASTPARKTSTRKAAAAAQ